MALGGTGGSQDLKPVLKEEFQHSALPQCYPGRSTVSLPVATPAQLLPHHEEEAQLQVIHLSGHHANSGEQRPSRS